MTTTTAESTVPVESETPATAMVASSASMPEDGEVFTVSQVAAATDVNASAVRFYEAHGVVIATRTMSNQRRFDGSSICRIQVAKLAQRVGMTVREIADLFSDLPSDPGPADWERIASQLVLEAESRLGALKTQLASLSTGGMLCEIGAQAHSGQS